MKSLFVMMLLTIFVQAVTAQRRVVQYQESNEDIVNPERGFYIPLETKASRFKKLDDSLLRSYRTEERKLSRASYAVKVSLIYRAYELDTFTRRPLSPEFLANLQEDFDIVRRSGLKMILRFMYTNRSHKGDCPDRQICPPYGDAPRDITLQHISQLKPVLHKNADIIAVVQEGFIGIWGENYYSDFWGDPSANGAGRIPDSSWTHRAQLLTALLDAIPENRMVQVRTPQIKQKFVHGPSAAATVSPMDSAKAFDGSDEARLGFHNDCFLASADDYGTYQDYGSSSQPPAPANETMRNYIERDTRYTVVGGETCDDAFSPQNDCAPAGYAEQEMRRMHYTYLNAAYNNQVNNDWDSAGCMYNIKRQLGYRLVLRRLEAPETTRVNSTVELTFDLENLGYAAPFNPRPAFLVLRNVKTGKEISVNLAVNPQKWFSGLHRFSERPKLPAALGKGNYKLFLSLPDASPAIANNPAYNVVFANENMVESQTGYMDLAFTLQVR